MKSKLFVIAALTIVAGAVSTLHAQDTGGELRYQHRYEFQQQPGAADDAALERQRQQTRQQLRDPELEQHEQLRQQVRSVERLREARGERPMTMNRAAGAGMARYGRR